MAAVLSEETDEAFRATLNERVVGMFEAMWPTLHHELRAMARLRWGGSPQGQGRPETPTARRRWRMTTTMRLLEAPAPTALERQLGTAAACIHVEVLCPVRAAIEGWTFTVRAFDGYSEAQLLGGASLVTLITPETAQRVARKLLRTGAEAGPGRYLLSALAPAGRRQPGQNAGRAGR